MHCSMRAADDQVMVEVGEVVEVQVEVAVEKLLMVSQKEAEQRNLTMGMLLYFI